MAMPLSRSSVLCRLTQKALGWPLFSTRRLHIVETEANGEEENVSKGRRRPPMCLYFTQNRCLYMDNKEHLERFSHSYPPELCIDPVLLVSSCPQPFNHFLVLDLEGKVEILEFPVVLVDAKTLQVVDRFHRFVRPCHLNGDRLQAYISGKYGRWKLENLWNDTAIPFKEMLESFESWLEQHSLLDANRGLQSTAFVTCGNWDVRTKIPQQCTTSGVPLPNYFLEWINLKDIYLNFYKHKATGMMAMLNGLNMKMEGSHHLGLDDAHNITRILQRLVCDGAILNITARRTGNDIYFLYDNRV